MRELLVIPELAGYAPQVGAALWRLEDARDRTLRLLRDMPAETIDRETPGNSVGAILYHVALIEADWLFAEILQEPIPAQLHHLLPVDVRDQDGILTAVRGQTLEEHLARLAAIRSILLDRLRAMTDEDFQGVRSLRQYDVSPDWVLHHLAQHEAEHRGELGAAIGH